MNRRWLAARLAVILAAAGLLPILLVGTFGIATLRSRGEKAAIEGLRAVADQSAGRVRTYLGQQRETLRMIAANLASDPQALTRLEELRLDAPSLGPLRLLRADAPEDKRPPRLGAKELAQAAGGQEVSSPVYLGKDLTPALDLCVPARGRPGAAICTSLDLLELQRLVQRIRIGEQGFALALDPMGHLLAAGLPELRAAVLTGERVAESDLLAAQFRGGELPGRFLGGSGQVVVAGWARLDELSWVVVVEQPVSEALAAADAARTTLAVALLLAIVLSLGVGIWQSRRVLGESEREERWRTAGRIAAGIAHDLGHRLAILQQTQSLAEMVALAEPRSGSIGYIQLIRDNLKSEVETLRKFVADFSDLSRGVNRAEFMPLDLGAFAEGMRQLALPQADLARVKLQVEPVSGSAPWVRGDRFLLERAMLNLLTNAIEASPPGSTVTLRLGADPAKGLAWMEVRDRGTGIAPERQRNIFDAFASTKRTGAHVGLGLPNVQRIARAHGGEIKLESSLGEGCRFTLWLPLAPRA